MATGNVTASYTTQCSDSSMASNDSEASSSHNIVHYGPIQIRLCRKTAPTLETGRRSKHLVLVGDEALRREKRREKNREAAKKLKEKRQLIEDELNEKLEQLEGEHSNLQLYLQQLFQRKEHLQEKVKNLSVDSAHELISNENLDIPLFFEQYPDDADLFDEVIESILNFDANISLLSTTCN